MKKNITSLLLLLAAAFMILDGCSSANTTPQKKEEPQQKEEEKEEEQEEEGDEPKETYPDLGNKCWTRTDIEDGIIYWEYNGFDNVSSAKQFVHVADIDMNKGYKFSIGYDGNSHITSDMHKIRRAIVTINGGYETSSIFIKYSGTVKHNIENDKISGKVTNWKNDGAICITDKFQPVILNTMCGDAEGTSKYGEALAAQRDFYRYGAEIRKYPHVISSAPILIDNFRPYGETYVYMTAAQYNTLDSEEPQRHQGVRHPRTVIATTKGGRLLLVVADGRYNSICNGFSAKEMTKFLVAHFNPMYALNMDGGGSSTMCVSGLGDPDTNVVNYPCDNGKADHDGERTVRTFFCVTK